MGEYSWRILFEMKTGQKGFVLAVTGGMASGKSTLSSLLRRHGAALLSLDELAHSLYEPGSLVHRRLLAEFGKGVAGRGGYIDRNKLGQLVFSRPEALVRLNGIVHPALRSEAVAAINRMRLLHRLVIVETGPLLVRLNLQGAVDGIVLVRASRTERIRRLVAGKGLSRGEAVARLRATESEEKCLEAGIMKRPKNISVDTTGSAERMGSLATRILGMVKQWR